jgi:thioredoxin reductase
MAGPETRFEDTCVITGVRNDISVVGEILEFRPQDRIVATIQRSAKVTLRWDARVQRYVGSISDVEFRSEGPKAHTFRTDRHR